MNNNLFQILRFVPLKKILKQLNLVQSDVLSGSAKSIWKQVFGDCHVSVIEVFRIL